jgi:hypothetical protein
MRGLGITKLMARITQITETYSKTVKPTVISAITKTTYRRPKTQDYYSVNFEFSHFSDFFMSNFRFVFININNGHLV